MQRKTIQCRGIIHGAFYMKNTCGNTKEILWGRSQSTLMEMFKYGRDNDGKITIAEREKNWGSRRKYL
ncbi:MAG: hypothetical protein HFJ58_01555 [Clostridia bacterium]|nr:hypothetical protein [Clostridia bacterium]